MGLTKEETRAYNRQYYKTNKEKIRKQMQEWRSRNRNYGPQKGQEWRDKNKSVYKQYRRTTYKLQLEKIAGRLMPDNCEICNSSKHSKTLYFDHDHKTGKFRGWICLKCNSALGMVNDNITTLSKMINYLQQN